MGAHLMQAQEQEDQRVGQPREQEAAVRRRDGDDEHDDQHVLASAQSCRYPRVESRARSTALRKAPPGRRGSGGGRSVGEVLVQAELRLTGAAVRSGCPQARAAYAFSNPGCGRMSAMTLQKPETAFRQTVEALGTDARLGLSEADARARLESHGRNELTAEKPLPPGESSSPSSTIRSSSYCSSRPRSRLDYGCTSATPPCLTKRSPSLRSSCSTP